MAIFSLFIIQPTSKCNYNCSYCYIPENLRRETIKISESILEESAKKILSCQLTSKNIKILWHSGEPLAVGINFYKKAFKIFQKYNIYNKNITHSIHTNASLINDHWIKLFKEHNVDVGVSLDGPQFYHDLNRRTWDDRGTFHQTMKGVAILRNNNFPLRAICVLNEESLKNPIELYYFFLKENFEFVAFNIDQFEKEEKNHWKDENMKDKFINFYNKFFYENKKNNFKIYNREIGSSIDIIKRLKVNPNFRLNRLSNVGLSFLTISNTGNISTYCPELATMKNNDETIIGNIKNISSLEDLFYSNKYIELKKKIDTGKLLCEQTCEFFNFCGGGDPSSKFFENGSFQSSSTTNCNYKVKHFTLWILDELNKEPNIENHTQNCEKPQLVISK